MAEFLSRAYESIYNYLSLAWEWSSENLFCRCGGKDSVSDHHINHRKPATKLSSQKKLPSSQIETMAKTSSKSHLTEVSTVKPVVVAASPPIINLPPLSIAIQNTPASTIPATTLPEVNHTNNPSTVPTTSTKATTSPLDNVKSLTHEPPKISFDTTGSIFGDRRKAGIETKIQLLDNGRFRSPGTSKTVMGPHGRQIRVSFINGFPSYKSIESRTGSLSGSMGGSLGSGKTRKSTESDCKIRKMVSTRTYKSQVISTSSEPELTSREEGTKLDEE